MKLSLPDEIDADDVDASGEPSEETVQVFGEEMFVGNAVEMMGEMLDRPEAFGLVPASRLTDVNQRIAEVEEENEQLRERLDELIESVREAYKIMDRAESIGDFSLKDDPPEQP